MRSLLDRLMPTVLLLAFMALSTLVILDTQGVPLPEGVVGTVFGNVTGAIATLLSIEKGAKK